jgi:hypothetical protein
MVKKEIMKSISILFFSLCIGVFLNAQQDIETASILASQRGEEKREQKKGLVLLPYKHQFKDYDGDVVASITGKNRNYKGGVTKLSNAGKNQQNISLDNFMNWTIYDFIYLSTHGSNVNGCFVGATKFKASNEEECRTLINTGIKIKDTIESKNLKIKYADMPGIVVGKKAIYLTDLFFKNHYPEGSLENKIIFLDACELGQFGEIPETFKTLFKNSHLLYWTNTVYSDDSYAAADYLFTKMTKEGLTLKRAYDQMPSGMKTGLKSDTIRLELIDKDFDIKIKEEVRLTTDLKLITVGEPQHLIEPVSLLDPKSRKELEDNQKYTFSGIYGDGKPELMTIDIALLGYTLSEIESEKMTISMQVNGKKIVSKMQLLPDLDPKDFLELKRGNSEFINWVEIKDLDIREDLQELGEVTLEVWFHFSEEKDGYQKLTLSLGNPDMRIEMQGPDGRVTLLYDADIDGMKIDYPKQRQTLYADKDGYAYANAEGRWMKIDFKNMMRMGAAMPMSGVRGIDVLANLPTPMHKIPYFVAEVTIPKLEKNPAAKKISSPGAPNTVFLVNGSVRVEFDENRKLMEIKEGGTSIKYFFEPQSIQYPAAQSIGLPF